MSAQTKKEQRNSAKLEVCQRCPKPLGADHRIIMGESLYFGNNIVADLGMKILPLGKGVIKIEILNTGHEMRSGIWDVGNRRAVFCNQDHPGLYLAFSYLHGYEELGKKVDHDWSEAEKKEAAAKYIVDLCFPKVEGQQSTLSNLLNCDFVSFVTLMTDSGYYSNDKLIKKVLGLALIQKTDEYVRDFQDDIKYRKKEIYKETGSEESFLNDDVLVRLNGYLKKTRERFDVALAIL